MSKGVKERARLRPGDGDHGRPEGDAPYFTLLPPMDEGFHIGYKPVPGVLCDHNQKPGEWLENFAKYIRAPGQDVGYSIPDVLASEQQLRRLARLPHELAMRHQEMVDYRAVLALLLLWDQLSADPDSATLNLEPFLAGKEESAFSHAVRAALPGARTLEGLRVFTLSRPRWERPEAAPVCLLSRAMALMPAANAGDLAPLLPPCVTWYDRARQRFTDPCDALDERLRITLIPRLRVLQALNESDPESYVYSPQAGLCALLQRFIADLLSRREPWRERLKAGDEAAEGELRTRVLTVYGLARRGAGALQVTELQLRDDEASMLRNPLLHQLAPGGHLPEPGAGDGERLYLLGDAPIARHSAAYLLEPAAGEGEPEALALAADEIALLDSYDDGWRRDMVQTLDELRRGLEGRTGVCHRVPELLARWRDEYAAMPERGDRDVVLRYPADTASATLSPLLKQLLGDDAEGCLREPFSDCLTLIDGAEQPPFGSAALNAACQVTADTGDKPLYFLPPLSPAMAAWLESVGERNDPLSPRLQTQSLFCAPNEDGSAMEARFCVACRVRGRDSAIPASVTFVREYPLRHGPESGGAYIVECPLLPSVTVWPNVRLSGERWRSYYVHAHRLDGADVWALTEKGWAQGQPYAAREEGGRRQATVRRWQTVRTERFPAYVVWKRGTLSLGALPNDMDMTLLKHDAPAVVAMDFGSIATTVMLRQGDKVQPAALPGCLHGALFLAVPEDERAYADELLPKTAVVAGERNESTFYSVQDMFTDDPQRWQRPLADGHIYYPRDFGSLLRKGENSLYYDLKWSEEEYVLRCLRLFLKQAMLQASLSARLWGSASVSWRVSVPTALPPHKQEAYLDMVRGLSHELAEECGLPLTSGCPPVLYAAENQADGLYFRSRNEVNARGGYLNLDIGGGTADMSLWLNHATHATAECSLIMGCRQMLYHSIVQGHIDDFESDFAGGDGPMALAAREIARALRRGVSTTRARQKTMLLTDDFFAAYGPEIRAAMAELRAGGRVAYTESLLLFNLGFLFHLCGMLLRRAAADGELRPLMPARMELCIAGNGGQLVKALTTEQRAGLCKLALDALGDDCPVKALLPVQSADPKREVALGLLSDDDALQSTLQAVDRWNGTVPGESADGAPADGSLAWFLLRFIAAFPQAAHLLLDGIYETSALRREVRLTPTAALELETVVENERRLTPDDDFATWVRCFTALKRLWRV